MTKTVIITGARAPAALHLARHFFASGHRVVLADTFRNPLSRGTTCKHAYVQLPPPRGNFSNYAAAIDALVQHWSPDLVIPTCEEVFYLAAVRDKRSISLPLFAPAFDRLARVHNKADFAGIAVGLGADPPATTRLESRADVDEVAPFASQLVFKPAWSRFGSRVLIKPTHAQLRQIAPTKAQPWVAQNYLPGPEICVYAVAREGRVVAQQAYQPTYRVGHGAGVAFERCQSEAARQFTSRIAETLNWTGQISFDFRHDEAGHLRVIECNPRATSGIHYFSKGDGLAQAILGDGAALASGRLPMTLPMAMVTFGLPYAWHNGGLMQWWRDFHAMGDITSWPDDRGMLSSQVKALGEIAVRAFQQRCDLVSASVRDIEWDGEDLA